MALGITCAYLVFLENLKPNRKASKYDEIET